MTTPQNNDELIRAIDRLVDQHGTDYATLLAVVQEWQRRQVAGEKFATETRGIADSAKQKTDWQGVLLWGLLFIVVGIVLILVVATINTVVRGL